MTFHSFHSICLASNCLHLTKRSLVCAGPLSSKRAKTMGPRNNTTDVFGDQIRYHSTPLALTSQSAFGVAVNDFALPDFRKGCRPHGNTVATSRIPPTIPKRMHSPASSLRRLNTDDRRTGGADLRTECYGVHS